MNTGNLRNSAAERFERHRRALEGLAYRMSGSLADAQDVVQEAWLRWSEARHAEIEDDRAWLLTCAGRLAVDGLRAARRRRAAYEGVWLPEPWLDAASDDPASRAELDDDVSIALMIALERLTPAERAAYILHEVFAHPFEEIARALGRTPEATRKLASRARARLVAERPRFAASDEQHSELLQAFLVAVRSGDVNRVEAVFVAHAELFSDGGGNAPAAPRIVRGARALAEFLVRVWSEPAGGPCVEPARFNGRPGLLVRQGDGTRTALAVEIEQGRILRLFAQRNPEKLAVFDER